VDGMRRLLLGTASLFALVVGTPVKAADLRVLPPASAAPGFSWTGAYVGANVGGAWGHADLSTSGDCSAPTSPPGYFCSQAAGGANLLAIAANGTGSIDAKSATGGIQGGFNWQIGNVLYGLESDFSWFHLSGTRLVAANYPANTQNNAVRTTNIYAIGTSFETNSLFTLRGRLGWTASNLLAYATGGLALTNLRVANSFTDNVGALGAIGGASNSDQRTGWTVGGGLEWALNNHWTVRGEYLYVNFGNQRITAATTVTNPSPGFAGYSNALGTSASDLTVQIARGGINYKF